MRRKARIRNSAGITLSMMFLAVLFALPALVEAKSEVVAIEGMRYNVNFSLEDNLKSLIGKKVLVTCDSGKTFSGFVKEVGNHLIHLEKLEGKEYFDALIRIENICAVEAQFWKVKR